MSAHKPSKQIEEWDEDEDCLLCARLIKWAEQMGRNFWPKTMIRYYWTDPIRVTGPYYKYWAERMSVDYQAGLINIGPESDGNK